MVRAAQQKNAARSALQRDSFMDFIGATVVLGVAANVTDDARVSLRFPIPGVERRRILWSTRRSQFAMKFLKLTLLSVLFAAGTAVFAAPDYKKIIGDWQSNYGPVHLSGNDSAALSGYWLEPPGAKKG